MKLRTNLMGALAVLMLATGCSSEEGTPGVNPDPGKTESVFATIRLQLPSTRMGTRSETDPDHNYDGTGDTNSSNGFEIGQDVENNISNLTLALATKNADGTYKPIASSSNGMSLPSSNPGDKIFTIMFDNRDILAAAKKEVYIFVFCNTTIDFTGVNDLFKHVTTVTEESSNTLWADNNFMMVNAPNKGLYTKTLPDSATLRHDYASPEKALDLGTVNVARVVSRFDFKNNNGANGTNLYPINDVNDESIHIADVKLLGMHPINIAKEFYTFPRVSADGTDKDWSLCGVEKWDNYVVSPNFADKAATLTESSALLGKYYFQQNEKTYDKLNYTDLSTFNGKDDDDNNWTAANKTGYKIWRYVTENTMPSAASQKKGITTGIVFKAEVVNPTANSPIDVAMKNKVAIYAYNGIYYGPLDSLRLIAAKQPATSAIHKDFLKVFGNTSLNYTLDEDTKKIVFDNALTDNDIIANNNTFKILRPTIVNDVAHYYVYYVYYNRHNDNGNSNEMAPMEFGTVRNNIYKLAVTSISELGHTNNPGDDPDPENPEDPDEKEKLYFKVSCRVLPWMVRVNNIEF